GHKMVARLPRPLLAHAFIKILVKAEGLGRSTRFARDDAEGPGDIDVRFDLTYGSRIGVVEHQKLGPALSRAKCIAADFSTEATAAHAEQHDVGEARVFNACGKRSDVSNPPAKCLNAVQPAQSMAN